MIFSPAFLQNRTKKTLLADISRKLKKFALGKSLQGLHKSSAKPQLSNVTLHDFEHHHVKKHYTHSSNFLR